MICSASVIKNDDEDDDDDDIENISDHLPSLVQYFVASLSSENLSWGKAENFTINKNATNVPA